MTARDPSRFARSTKVPADRSETQLRQMLRDAGASSMSVGQDEDLGILVLQFKLGGYRIRFIVPTPNPEDLRWRKSGARPAVERTKEELKAAVDQAERALWRGLYQTIFFKLYTISQGYEVEDEFLAQIVDPDTGKTMKEQHVPDLKARYSLPPGPNRLMIEPPKE